MDGIHDMGGMDGFGKVDPEHNEPVFHEGWEGRVLAMNRAMGASGSWNIDMGRLRDRIASTACLPGKFLLQEVVSSARADAYSARPYRSRRDSGWPRVASRQDLEPWGVNRVRCRACVAARLVRTASTGAGAV
jgi:hypothetical protein